MEIFILFAVQVFYFFTRRFRLFFLHLYMLAMAFVVHVKAWVWVWGKEVRVWNHFFGLLEWGAGIYVESLREVETASSITFWGSSWMWTVLGRFDGLLHHLYVLPHLWIWQRMGEKGGLTTILKFWKCWGFWDFLLSILGVLSVLISIFLLHSDLRQWFSLGDVPCVSLEWQCEFGHSGFLFSLPTEWHPT